MPPSLRDDSGEECSSVGINGVVPVALFVGKRRCKIVGYGGNRHFSIGIIVSRFEFAGGVGFGGFERAGGELGGDEAAGGSGGEFFNGVE